MTDIRHDELTATEAFAVEVIGYIVNVMVLLVAIGSYSTM